MKELFDFRFVEFMPESLSKACLICTINVVCCEFVQLSGGIAFEVGVICCQGAVKNHIIAYLVLVRRLLIHHSELGNFLVWLW